MISPQDRRQAVELVKEAVAQGLLPKYAQGEDAYLKMHNQIQAVLKAALAAK